MHEPTSFLDAAATGRNSAWRSVAGAIVVFVSWQVAAVSGTLAGVGLASVLALPAPYDAMVRLAGVFMAPIGLLSGLWLVQRLIHRRSLLSLVTTSVHLAWGRIALGAAVWAALLAAAEIVAAMLEPGAYRLTFGAGPFFASLVVLVPLIALQAVGEELYFRGYLLQAMGRYARSSWVLLPAGAVLFALPHLGNPEVASGGWPVVVAYALMGGLLTAVALRDGRLELAIGLHVVNNLAAAVVVGTATSVIAGAAPMFTTAEASPVLTLTVTAVQATVFWLVVFRRPQAT